MKELALLNEKQLSSSEIQKLAMKAETFLSTDEGQKALQEVKAMHLLDHGLPAPVEPSWEYSAEDYLEHPELFSITNFSVAVFIPETDALFTSENPFSTRDELGEEIKEAELNFEPLIITKKWTTVTGEVFTAESNHELKFFSCLSIYSPFFTDEVVDKLTRSGWLPLHWHIEENQEDYNLSRVVYKLVLPK